MVNARATAFGEEYQYCRTCKKELSEMQPQVVDSGSTTIKMQGFYELVATARPSSASLYYNFTVNPTPCVAQSGLSVHNLPNGANDGDLCTCGSYHWDVASFSLIAVL